MGYVDKGIDDNRRGVGYDVAVSAKVTAVSGNVTRRCCSRNLSRRRCPRSPSHSVTDPGRRDWAWA